MQAVAVRAFHSPPELMELEPPRPGPGEVRVRMAAAGVNPLDWKVSDGIYDGERKHRFPLVLGVDGAGWVESCGPGVSRFGVGDPIFGQFLHDPVGDGTFAELAITPESIGVTKFPAEIPPTAAAALPTAGMSALQALDELGVAPGGTLLLVGASGGVGSYALQVARTRQLRVIAVARAGSETRLKRLGATEVLEFGSPSLEARVRALAPAGVDALLDAASRAPEFQRLSALVRAGGRAMTIIHVADPRAAPADGIERINFGLHPTGPLLDRVVREVVEHRLLAPIEREISLSGVPTALAESRAGHASGKTVVRIGAPSSP